MGGLVGNRQHAERQVAQGTDVIVAQGTEAGGHCGDVSTMVLVPEVVDAVGPDVPVLAAGGIGRGRQMAAALALGAQGVWTGSIWLTVAEADTQPDRVGEPAGGQLARHGALAVDDREAGAAAAHRVDRRVGARRHSRSAARCRSRASCSPRRRVGSPRAQNSDLTGFPVGQIVGSMNSVRPVRDVIFDMVEEWVETTQRLDTLIETDDGRELATSSGSTSSPSLVIASTRSSRQRERLQRALGLGVSETNLGALRLIATPRTDRGQRDRAPPEIDQSNASRQVRALEEQGLVVRSVDPADRRVARLGITAVGSARAGQGARRRAQRLRGRARRTGRRATVRSSPSCSTASGSRCSQAETDESGWAVGKTG